MKRPTVPCPCCGGDHAAQLLDLEDRERQLRGPDLARLDADASAALRGLRELLDAGPIAGGPEPCHNRMVSARPEAPTRAEQGRGVAGRSRVDF